MTSKAFELAQLGDTVTIDGSGNVDVAGNVTVASGGDGLRLNRSGYDSYSLRQSTGSGIAVFNNTDSRTEMFFKGDGNVGIGTTDPIADFSLVDSSTGSGMEFQPEVTTNTNRITNYDRVESAYKNFRLDATEHQFYVSGSQKMLLSDSGDLRVGKTTTALADVGHELDHTGYAYHTRDGGTTMYLNRKTNDGNFIQFYKDTSSVGSIGVNGSNLYIGKNNTGFVFNQANDQINPARGDNGNNRDNVIDLGSSSVRFDDIYATNSSIQTSDQNEKQQIAPLTGAEIIAAKAISQLFKTYKWNSSVESKGDNARTHTGVIAQEVETAMSDAGLDAGNYAFFISNTWWETSTEVAAVEADEENGIEAQEAYTRIDTYNTSEEAPEGAVERNRKGIRYPELLSFIGAATEQRLTSIEARLDALETE